jgi:hypothetical protein
VIKTLGISLLTAVYTRTGVAQSVCAAKPGSHHILIPLQGGAASYEPQCQPARLRVSDRRPLTIRITGLSPIDVCTTSAKPPTLTVVANPLEAIVNSVSALKSFDFSSAEALQNEASGQLDLLFIPSTKESPPTHETPEEKKKREEEEKKAAAAKAADAAALALFKSLNTQVLPAAKDLYAKQLYWFGRFQSDVTAMSLYLEQDYRLRNYTKFLPETDLSAIKADTSFPPAAYPPTKTDIPSELDWAALQALADQMKSLETRLITSCTTAGQSCKPDVLQLTAQLTDQANAFILVAQDNLKTLQADQAAIVTAYNTIDKIYLDFQNRLKLGTVQIDAVTGILFQDIPLGPDYGETDTGTVSCMSDALSTQATTDVVNYSVLYQNLPALTAGAGLLVSTLRLNEIATQPELVNGTYGTYFAVTQSSPLQMVPMGFVNYRTWRPKLTTVWGEPETEMVIANSLSGGIGINANSGTNQPEFFIGDAVSFNRVYIHFGEDWGRTESLGGGFMLNTVVPTGFAGSAPIQWSYHPAFAFGFSVRVAPF